MSDPFLILHCSTKSEEMSDTAAIFLPDLADVLGPVLQILLDLGHELAGIGAVDDAVVEAQREVQEERMAMESVPSSSVTTAGSLKSPPTPRIADSG